MAAPNNMAFTAMFKPGFVGAVSELLSEQDIAIERRHSLLSNVLNALMGEGFKEFKVNATADDAASKGKNKRDGTVDGLKEKHRALDQSDRPSLNLRLAQEAISKLQDEKQDISRDFNVLMNEYQSLSHEHDDLNQAFDASMAAGDKLMKDYEKFSDEYKTVVRKYQTMSSLYERSLRQIKEFTSKESKPETGTHWVEGIKEEWDETRKAKGPESGPALHVYLKGAKIIPCIEKATKADLPVSQYPESSVTTPPLDLERSPRPGNSVCRSRHDPDPECDPELPPVERTNLEWAKPKELLAELNAIMEEEEEEDALTVMGHGSSKRIEGASTKHIEGNFDSLTDDEEDDSDDEEDDADDEEVDADDADDDADDAEDDADDAEDDTDDAEDDTDNEED
ncbi:hypothetical protein R3P38DRAFT_3168344 [Favolaschia claudopus]|uniref:Uncharacterized protein n=1 Tax=Favolaschia claudopus TaxID=2862362 RepID=A0AAW0E8Z3_9AGAR